MTTKEKKPKTRAHKESKGSARGARKTRLTDLQKYLMTGKSTTGMAKAGRAAQLHTEEKAKKELAEKRKKESGHEGFRKLKAKAS